MGRTKARAVRSGEERSRSRSRKRRTKKLVGREVRVSGEGVREVGRRGLVRLCVTKLARIADPEAKLCRAVLINNTLRKAQKQVDRACVHLEEQEEEEGLEEEEEVASTRDDDSGDITEVVADRMGMCQDIIDGFLDLINSQNNKDVIEEKSDDRTLESSLDNEEEGGSECLSEFVSPYSYGSFLSEVYKESMSRILRKVEK